jgi:Zinc finger, C2H2 type
MSKNTKELSCDFQETGICLCGGPPMIFSTPHGNETCPYVGHHSYRKLVDGDHPCWYEGFGPADWEYQISPHPTSVRIKHQRPSIPLLDTQLAQNPSLCFPEDVATATESSCTSPTSSQFSMLASQTTPSSDTTASWTTEQQPTGSPISWADSEFSGRTIQSPQTSYRENGYPIFADEPHDQADSGPWSNCDGLSGQLSGQQGSSYYPEVRGVFLGSMSYATCKPRPLSDEGKCFTHIKLDLDCEGISHSTSTAAPVPISGRHDDDAGDVGRSNTTGPRPGSGTSNTQHVEPLRDGLGNWICSECVKQPQYTSFSDHSNCVRHIKGSHGLRGKPRQVYLCPECERPYTRLDNLKVHMRSMHKYAPKNIPPHIEPSDLL